MKSECAKSECAKSEWRGVSVWRGVRSERDMGSLLDLEFLRFLRSCRKYSNELSAADDGREVCVRMAPR